MSESPEPREIWRVRVHADAAREARESLHIQIREARIAGMTLRAIAVAAGLSHEAVRQLTR